MTLKVGAKIFRFDPNRRIYKKDPVTGRDGRGGPIWREHWSEVEITGETSRSWVFRWNEKIPKKGPLPWGYLLNAEEVDRAAWAHDNIYEICEAVRRCRDYDKLRAIAELIGWKERTK